MKKLAFYCLSLSACLSLLAGCTDSSQQSSQPEKIPFAQDQYYAAAHVGYQQIDDLDYYTERYLDSDQISIHYLSDGDYYLIIPRYSGMKLSLFRNDLESSEPILIYEDPDCEPFLLQCNVSDIFPDATVRLTYQDHTAEFSPFISLKDGSVDIGTQGLDLTKEAGTQQPDL